VPLELRARDMVGHAVHENSAERHVACDCEVVLDAVMGEFRTQSEQPILLLLVQTDNLGYPYLRDNKLQLASSRGRTIGNASTSTLPCTSAWTCFTMISG
jgi:hypothetical protein